jgi:hypothetical protein
MLIVTIVNVVLLSVAAPFICQILKALKPRFQHLLDHEIDPESATVQILSHLFSSSLQTRL